MKPEDEAEPVKDKVTIKTIDLHMWSDPGWASMQEAARRVFPVARAKTPEESAAYRRVLRRAFNAVLAMLPGGKP